MAESKSSWFALSVNKHSEKSRRFDFHEYKRLADILESRDDVRASRYESSRPLTGAATKRGPAWPKINTQPPPTRPIAAPRDLLWPTRKGSHMLLAFVLGRP